MATNTSVNSPLSGTSGTGSFAGTDSPVFTSPDLGTPSAVALTNATAVPAAALSGTVDVANGGTGQTSYTDGQLLIGNSTGNTLTKASLTAGSNITITPGSGSITIAATSGGSGVVVKQVRTQLTSGQLTSAAFTLPAFPNDISVFGTVMSLAITPASASNILVVEVDTFLSANVQDFMTVAIFRDDETDAIAARSTVVEANNRTTSIYVSAYTTAATTSTITFNIGYAANGGGNDYYFGSRASETGTYGGTTVNVATLKITEYTP